MKKINLTAIALIVLSITINISGQDNSFFLNGTINPQYNGQNVTLFTFSNDTINTVDTTTVIDGKFTFQGEEYLEDFSVLSIGSYPDTVIGIELVLEQGVIDVELKSDGSTVLGTFYNKLYSIYKDINNLFIENMREHAPDDFRIEPGTPYHKWLTQLGYFQVNFKKNNIHNVVGQKLFKDELGKTFGEDFAYGEDSAFYLIYNAADEKFKSDPQIVSYMEERLKEKEANDMRLKMVGELYTDFELQTPEGKTKKISDYIGKSDYLYIEFWASWCGPCIADMPYLKEIYEKYKDKGLNIIGISLDTRKTEWQRGLERIDVPWDNLSDLKGMHSSELAEAYAVEHLPYALLLDRTGKVVEVNLRGIVLEQYLNYLLK